MVFSCNSTFTFDTYAIMPEEGGQTGEMETGNKGKSVDRRNASPSSFAIWISWPPIIRYAQFPTQSKITKRNHLPFWAKASQPGRSIAKADARSTKSDQIRPNPTGSNLKKFISVFPIRALVPRSAFTEFPFALSVKSLHS